jgi:predicted DNA-binding protein
MKRKRRLTGSLTVRLSAPLQRRVRALAKKRGETPSDYVRSLIERDAEISEAEGPTLLERIAPLLARTPGSRKVAFGENAREELEKWNPDRRD